MLDHASDLAGQFVGAVRETHGARINQPIQSTAVVYFAALAAALVVDTVPVFAPPAWTILAFIIVKWEPNPWAIIAAGAIGSVIGRYILTLYMPRVSAKIFRRWENDNLSFLGKKLGGRFWHANTFVMLYAISPLSTTALFTAAGMARRESMEYSAGVRPRQIPRRRMGSLHRQSDSRRSNQSAARQGVLANGADGSRRSAADFRRAVRRLAGTARAQKAAPELCHLETMTEAGWPQPSCIILSSVIHDLQRFARHCGCVAAG
jgi:hypothetical protein